jgi:hypothetical protein
MKKTFPGSADSGKVPAEIFTIAWDLFTIEDDTGWVPPLQLLIAGGNLLSLPLAICIKNPQIEECTEFRGFFYNNNKDLLLH